MHAELSPGRRVTTKSVAPKRITSDLLDRLNELSMTPSLGDDEMRVAIGQIRFRARGLTKADRAEAYCVEGICSSLLNDLDGTRSAFESALGLSGWNEAIVHNYVTSLDDMGQYELAGDVATRMFMEAEPASKELLEYAISICVNSGRLKSAAVADEMLYRLYGTEPMAYSLCTAVHAAENAGIDLDLMGTIIKQTRRFLFLQGFRRCISQMAVLEGFGGIPHISLAYAPPVTVRSVRDIERKLFEEIVALDKGDTSVFDWMTISLSGKTYAGLDLHAA